MNAAPDSHHPLFLGECGDSSELAREFRVDAVDNGDSARRIVPEDRREQRRNRSGLDGRLNGYSGCIGVAFKGNQPASRSVESLPSMSPFRIAVKGRQKL